MKVAPVATAMSETGVNCCADSFHSHLQSLVEDYQQEIITLRRQLREESGRGVTLAEEAKKYRIEYQNYKLSHVMDQATIKELKRRVRYLEKEKFNRVKASSSEVNKQQSSSKSDPKDHCQSTQTTSCVENESPTLPKVLPNLPISPTKPNNLKLKYRNKMNSLFMPVTKPFCMCRFGTKESKDVDNN